MSHTPGPWSSIPQRDGSMMVVRVTDDGTQMQPRRIRMVAHVLTRKDSLSEDDANARLIAAAPQLLEALGDIASWAGKDKRRMARRGWTAEKEIASLNRAAAAIRAAKEGA